MPLTKLQEAVAGLLAVNRTPDSYLAGGAALHIEPNSKRYSNDLDYFNDSEARVASAFEDDQRLLFGSGYELLLSLLRRRGRYRPEDFARLALTSPVDLPALKRAWLDALDAAERFLAARDPDEVGCLYYSAADAAFVEPRPGQPVIPHFGRPGGVLPVLSN